MIRKMLTKLSLITLVSLVFAPSYSLGKTKKDNKVKVWKSQFFGQSEDMDRCFTLAGAMYYRAPRFVVPEDKLEDKGPCFRFIETKWIDTNDTYIFGYNYAILWEIKIKDDCHSANQLFTQACMDYVNKKKPNIR